MKVAMQDTYRILKQWRYTGETPVMTIEKFKFVFGLTEKKYKLSDIDRRFLILQ